jgi:hypothetical protein
MRSLDIWLKGDTSMTSITRIAEQICWFCENVPELALGCMPTYVRQSVPAIPPPVPPPPAPPAPPASPSPPVPPSEDFFRLSDLEMSAEDYEAFWQIGA